MRRLHLVATTVSDHGLAYVATEEAYPFVELMKTDYALKLKERATWLANNILPQGNSALHKLIAEKLGRWNIEFQTDQAPIGPRQ